MFCCFSLGPILKGNQGIVCVKVRTALCKPFIENIQTARGAFGGRSHEQTPH